MHLWQRIVISIGILVLSLLISWVISRLTRQKISSTWGKTFGPTLNRALIIFTVLTNSIAAMFIWELSKEQRLLFTKILVSLTIISVTFIVASVVTGIIKVYKNSDDHGIAAATLTRNIANIIISVLGLVVLLHYFNLSITPMLTAMGIGGIAIALGLQDTLSNLFAGINIVWAGRIRIGNYIKLNSGEEGFVYDIAWRETRMRTSSNNMLTLPNNLITKASIINFNQPNVDVGLNISVVVDFGSNLEHVEKVTYDLACEVLECVPGSVMNSKPSVRFKRFCEMGIELHLDVRTVDYSAQSLIKHELIKRLYKRFNEEGIVIPYAARMLLSSPKPYQEALPETKEKMHESHVHQ